ncbi:hypothetical protein XA68_18501 [Ophiocordyceps unilateralis]|uniref:Uncharacterized protein n=1 Tax=Ophiocordyceps unilateralis TaxID=268505 RepID=A0A2A9PJ90_OPHUN|nr:hypothetical protein XA68_18501 [Ophiocordyceps unilateralis]
MQASRLAKWEMPVFTIRYPRFNEEKVLDFIWMGLLSIEVLLIVGVALQALLRRLNRKPGLVFGAERSDRRPKWSE